MLFHSYYAQHNWQNVTHPINHQLHFIGLSKKNRPRSIWFAIPPGTSGGAFPLKSVVTPFIGSTNVSGWWPHLRIHPGSSDFVSNGLCVSKECFQALKGFLLKKLYWCNATTWYAVYWTLLFWLHLLSADGFFPNISGSGPYLKLCPRASYLYDCWSSTGIADLYTDSWRNRIPYCNAKESLLLQVIRLHWRLREIFRNRRWEFWKEPKSAYWHLLCCVFQVLPCNLKRKVQNLQLAGADINLKTFT